MEELMSKLRQMRDAVYQRLDIFTTDFDTWKEPWTEERAEFLDVPVSSRANQQTADLIVGRISDPTSSNLNTVMGKLNSLLGFGERVEFLTPGSFTWTVPNGVTNIKVMIVGGGGGGGGGTTGMNPTQETYTNTMPKSVYRETSRGSAGGSGAYQLIDIDVTPGQSYNVVVGAGGTGGAGGILPSGYNGAVGQNGGASSFGTFVSGGGKGGKNGVDSAGGEVLSAPGIVESSNGGAGTKGFSKQLRFGSSVYDGVVTYYIGTTTTKYTPPEGVYTFPCNSGTHNILNTSAEADNNSFGKLKFSPDYPASQGGIGGGCGKSGTVYISNGELNKTWSLKITNTNGNGKSGTAGTNGLVVITY